MTLKLAVSRSRPPVPYGANLFYNGCHRPCLVLSVADRSGMMVKWWVVRFAGEARVIIHQWQRQSTQSAVAAGIVFQSADHEHWKLSAESDTCRDSCRGTISRHSGKHCTGPSPVLTPLRKLWPYRWTGVDVHIAVSPHYMHSIDAAVVAGVTWSVSLCWTHGCDLQKWLNWSRCCLGIVLCGPKEPCIRWGSRLDESISRREGW